MKLFWILPTRGDPRQPGASGGEQALGSNHLKQIAGAVDNLGFHGAVLPTSNSSEEAWVAASALIGSTSRIKFLVAVRPGQIAPSLAARMAASFDRLSGGRLLMHVVTGGSPAELAGDGLFLDDDARYELTDEFLHIWRRLLAGRCAVDFAGRHLRVKGARAVVASVQRPYPALYMSGWSPAQIEVAARHADHYLIWGGPPATVAEKVAVVRAAASRNGRRLRFGIRLHVIVRETDAEARRVAEQQFTPGQPTGAASATLIGDADIVAERLREYAAVGIETFVLSGHPDIEEVYRTAELLFPRLPLELEEIPVAGANPKGEYVPSVGHNPDLVP